MSARPKPLHREVALFVEHHLRKGCFAPHTGQDWPAWRAFVYLVECYSHGGGHDAIIAMPATVRCAQRREDILRTFVQTIPAVMDWGDVAHLWPRIADGILLPDGSDPRLIAAVERCEVGKNGLGNKVRLHGWRPREDAAPEARL